MYSHQGPVLSVCWNKARLFNNPYSSITNIAFRKEIKSSLVVQTTPRACSTSRPDNHSKWHNTTPQSVLSNGLMHRKEEFLLLEVGIRLLRWVKNSLQVIMLANRFLPTGQYWDLRTPTPVSTVQLPERCYSMDVQYPLMVVGTAERHIQIFNLTNPTAAYKVNLLIFKFVESSDLLCS